MSSAVVAQHDRLPAKKLITFVLVYGSLRTGGIETLIVRLARYLTNNGYDVLVCCGKGPLLTALPESVDLVTFADTAELHTKFLEVRPRLELSRDTIVISFDPISAARALFVELALPPEPTISHISGIFHPRAYFMTGERRDRIALNHWVAKAIGYPSLLFMNDECRDSHAVRWGVDLSASSIATLPIDVKEQNWAPRMGSQLRIISIGRLVDFKAYNLEAPKLVRELRERGLHVTWDIFGSGPLHEEVIAEIRRNGVEGLVRLRGELSYQDFSQVVVRYDIFVGMGTAALEAAMLGVPTICCTESQRERCYGYLHDLPFGNVGELQSWSPTVEIIQLIETFAHADGTSRSSLSLSCRTAALRYGIDGFVDTLIDVHHSRPIKASRSMKRLVAVIYRFVTEGFAVRRLRRLVKGTS